MILSSTEQIRKLAPKDKIEQFHRVSQFKGIASIFIEWGFIIACAFLCNLYFTWYFYLFSIIFIGARLLALGLIMHESVHNLISKNQFINDWTAEFLCAWPLLISMRSYKIKHLAHHAWLNTDEDPDYVAKTDVNWRYPMRRNKLIKILAVQLSGLGIFETFKVMSGTQMKSKKVKSPIWYNLLRLTFYSGIISAFIFTENGMILILYWLIPFATWTQIANRLRRIAEHSGIGDKSSALQTRTTTHGLITRILLAPKFISYHNEHHIYPGIPCYNLRKTHKTLLENEEIKSNLHISKSYYDVYNECVIND